MPKSSFETWVSIRMPEHRDPYYEFVEGNHTFTTIDERGARVPIEVENQCIFGCGHCDIVTKTRDALERVQCQK